MSRDHWNAWKTSPELAQLAEDYSTTPRPDWTDTDDLLNHWLNDEPDLALSAICAIIQSGCDMKTLHALAAGPLEAFLTAHGEQYIDTIRTLASGHDLFFKTLCCVWQGGMSKVLWQKVRAICAGRLK